MYQPLQSDMRTPPGSGSTVHTLDAGRAYEGQDRRREQAAPVNVLDTITPMLVIEWLRRFWLAILALAVLGAIVGFGAGTLVKPRFTSYSDILLDPTSLQIVADDLYTSNIQGEAQLLEVESKMRVLGSTNVLARTVRDLGLDNDPDLMEPEFALFGAASAGEDNFTAAVRALSERVRIRREERSYIVTASVWARTPEQSAVLTNGLITAFLAEMAEAEADGARNASAALTQRLDELRTDAESAEAAVAAYRRENGLQMTGADQLSTQSAVQLNTQIAAARQALIDAEARYAALSAGGDTLISTAPLESTALAGMRTQYATARQEADALAATLGPRHPSLATARAQLTALQSEIDRETRRLIETARRELAQARSVVDQLEVAATEQMGAVFTDDQAQLQLRQLERAAASKVGIYEAYFERAQQIAQRSELSTNNVRVISPAIPPISRSYPPRTVLLIAAGLIGGLVLGVGLALMLGLGRLYFPQRPTTADA
ncbi:MAG: GumC family protein [Devosia sp.]|uniref:GumC family protein n=1 Tax=unclassified Devosia TaxID=196773 RepID=UPI001A0E9E68|nr:MULTISPECIES: GumC family protein [unclassified Devosia]MBF0679015.1 GumC family protein [Devosia sp.]WEJ33629.1 GumC family protein [Devosia sp. SD17-2]